MAGYNDFLEVHDHFKEKSISNRLIEHKSMVGLFNKYFLAGKLRGDVYGKSVKGKSIYYLQYGKGPLHILLWSQMHGDEPTATAALLDIFNFLNNHPDRFDGLLQDLEDKLTITFIPMLNPDGAGEYKRYNALGIDLNRDALALSSPESKLLKQAFQEFKPMFAFNLHDQKREHAVSTSGKPATISFLAPSPFPEAILPDNQKRAIKLIEKLYIEVSKKLYGHVGRYDDPHTPTAFGDNFQKWGAATILLESGAFPEDFERQVARQHNFALLLHSFQLIASNDFSDVHGDIYDNIPLNVRRMHDVIYRNITVKFGSKEFKVDLALDFSDEIEGDHFIHKPYLMKLGDLRLFYGYQEIEGNFLMVDSPYPLHPETRAEFKIAVKETGETVIDLKQKFNRPTLPS